MKLSKHYGPTHWWPGDTSFEIAVGAILTQNAAWSNVEKAIINLKRDKILTPKKIMECPGSKLESALRPSGYFRLKAKRLRSFCEFLLTNYNGSMAKMSKRSLKILRPDLLDVNGIGPETADDILLYACNKTVFVIDAYTRRILGRHGLIDKDIKYEELRELFETNLSADLKMFKEYHGLIVYTGKDFCRRNPKCELCPLAILLKKGQPII